LQTLVRLKIKKSSSGRKKKNYGKVRVSMRERGRKRGKKVGGVSHYVRKGRPEGKKKKKRVTQVRKKQGITPVWWQDGSANASTKCRG